jgi:hypothetical protein
VNWRGDINASQTAYMQAAQNTAQVFLGVNLKCASCHDSFINRYKLRESYGMAALFSSEAQLELVRCDVKTGKYTGPQLLYPELGAVPENATLEERHAAAARFFTDPRNGRVARTIVNRYWQKLFGRGLVEPVDEMDGEPWNADLLDWLASDFTAHASDLRYLLRLLMTSKAYQLAAAVTAEQAEKPYVFRGPMVRRLSAEQFADTVSMVTGEWRLLENGKEALPARDWQFKASPLALALGRPIRDQVFTTRDNRPTTFQALELANGASLEHTCCGAAPCGCSAGCRRRPRTCLIAACCARARGIRYRHLRLKAIVAARGGCRVVRSGSYVGRGWAEVRIERAGRLAAKLTGLAALPVGTQKVIPIAGLGYTRMRGSVALDNRSHPATSRAPCAFSFWRRAGSGAPGARGRAAAGARAAGARERRRRPFRANLYRQLLAREPNPDERNLVRSILGAAAWNLPRWRILLWSLLLHPEFQYLY